ncbi:hypothetical protein TNIN_139351 [Trichonephila inaurata madagascariensis]|uniref:Uncharacterized protein n=1 Tax=Trichonephila inaurata madagascariensis TaxID=2747483 RepID=A0A8X7BUN8_9ARAC|nr:hypothetical protein TNIN_139351 [Trichonephila inaurata madagascariensis]
MALTSDLTNIMELSLPSSPNSSRPGTPTATNCERLTAIQEDIEKFGIVIEATKSTIKTLLFTGVADDNDPTLLDHNRRLDEYQRLQQLAEPTKTSAIKRKDNEDGYISSSSRQIAKNRTISQAELNFKFDLQNKFQNLKIDQIDSRIFL